MQAHINELHYDNSGADTGEAVEVAGPAGLSLDGSSIVFYSSGGSQYKSTSLSGTIPDCGALSFEVSGIQNGVCGLVLVAADGTLGPLLSYEGVLTATEGPAAGVTSADIGVAESSATPVGSLQLQGDGSTWAVGATSSFGALNAGQSCASSPPSPPPSLPSPPVAPCPPRSELRQSLIGHTAYPYTSSSTDTWDVLREADAAATDATLVYLLYANATTDGAQEYNGGAGWSREHLWPQSLAEYHATRVTTTRRRPTCTRCAPRCSRATPTAPIGSLARWPTTTADGRPAAPTARTSCARAAARASRTMPSRARSRVR